jgi:hypothetical protein
MKDKTSLFIMAEHYELAGRLRVIQDLLRGINQTLKSPAHEHSHPAICGLGKSIALATRALQDRLEEDYMQLVEGQGQGSLPEFYDLPDPEEL